MNSLLLSLALLAASAPAPFDRGQPNEPLTGTWAIEGGAVSVTFLRDGTYEERWYGTSYSGVWSRQGTHRTRVWCHLSAPWVGASDFHLTFQRHGPTVTIAGYDLTLRRLP